MDTDKSNPKPDDAQMQNSQAEGGQQPNSAPQGTNADKAAIIRQFLGFKVKIHHMMNQDKLDEAKEAYHQMYALYQDIVNSLSPQEGARLQNDLSSIYSKLMSGITNKKRVKRGKGVDKVLSKPTRERSKKEKKKIMTTDLDMVIKIVEEKGKMNMSEIQSTFNIGRRLAEEWIQILSDYGLVEIRYLPVGGIEITKIKS